MPKTYFSPLRYPGGKSSLFDFTSKVLNYNNLNDGIYAEAYAGGAGMALRLLMEEYVSEIYLNDKDYLIYCFWKSVLDHNEELIKLIKATNIEMGEWHRRVRIAQDKKLQSELSIVELGFTAFYLNRCNRSGILEAGVIGGLEQAGEWRMDARFNKEELLERIYRIGFYKDRIKVSNLDAETFIAKLSKGLTESEKTKLLLYLDPPYVQKGKQLYREFYIERDHVRFARFIKSMNDIRWVISYDDDPLIHKLYKGENKNEVEFNYFANRTKLGKELVISSSNCLLPDLYLHYSRWKSVKCDKDVFKEPVIQFKAVAN